MDKVISEFRKLMAEAGAEGPQNTTGLLLRLMEPGQARALDACAIPHTFNEKVLAAMLPELDRSQSRAYCEAFTKLSLVKRDQDGLSLHDRARKELFDRWLEPARQDAFSLISRRLVAYYEGEAGEGSDEARAMARRLRMFHLVGADQHAGFPEFESLCRQARSQFRLSECANVVRLIHEYDPVLTPENTLRLAYHEGKLNSDMHEWELAESLFKTILESADAPAVLRVKALVRLGYLSCRKQLWIEAVAYYRKALALVPEAPEMRDKVCRITHDLGAAYRDAGNLVEAEELLKQSIRLSESHNDLTGMALGCNSLGMLQLKRGDIPAAIDAFRKSLEHLTRGEQTFRTAQVLNNLGLAYDQRTEWQTSEQYFRKSLEIKRQAGDSLGQAFVLNNLARTQVNQDNLEAAVSSYTEAISLFEQMHDPFDLAVAKRNRGKLYRRLRIQELCQADFLEAIRVFHECGRGDEAASVQEELDSLTRSKRLPMWAWVGILLFPLLLVLYVILVAMIER